MMIQLQACFNIQRFFCVIILCCTAFAKADAQTATSIKNETQFSESEFTIVDIDIYQYLNLIIKTTNEDRVQITTSQNGEYKNAVILSGRIRNDSLLIRDPINPSFSFPEDKLSAHKIIDGTAILILPRDKRLVINTNAADISITGDYKNVYVNQLSGTCKINKIEGNMHYISVYADVFVELENYDIICRSKTGKISPFEKDKLIKYFATLETVSGNITNSNKTKK